MQMNLPLPANLQPQDVADVLRRPTFGQAVAFALDISGKNTQMVCAEMGLDPGNWSRILSGTRHFPVDELAHFQRLVDNPAPLVWLAHHCGFDPFSLRVLLTETERRLKAVEEELASARAELEITQRFVGGAIRNVAAR